MAITFDNVAKEIKQCAIDFCSGACFKNFAEMIPDRQLETIVKVGLLAIASGIICGVLFGGGAVCISAIVGLGSFAYYTNDNQVGLASTFGDVLSATYREIKSAINSL